MYGENNPVNVEEEQIVIQARNTENRNVLLNQGENWKSEFGWFEEHRLIGPRRPWAPGLRAAPGIAPSEGGFSLVLRFFRIQPCPSVWHIQLCGLIMPI